MSLYNCKSDGDQYRISKFSNDLDVEASYLTDGAECDCPAGHRPVCRHRIMLSRFIAKNATAGQWFHNYEANQWIRAASDGEPDTLGDLASAASELTGADGSLTTMLAAERKDWREDLQKRADERDLERHTINSPINLLELAKPIPELHPSKFTGFEPKPLRRL